MSLAYLALLFLIHVTWNNNGGSGALVAPGEVPEFDIYRQVFALSLLSNSVTDLVGDTADVLLDQFQLELSAYLNISVTNATFLLEADPTFIQQFGAWSVVWGGGGVARLTPHRSEQPIKYEMINSAYVAFNPAASFPNETSPVPTYVVAIAGTNSASRFDWLREDADIRHTIQWNVWNPNDESPTNYYDQDGMQFDPPVAVISKSAAIGAGFILRMTAPPGVPGTGQTLQQFLSAIPQTGATVVITGHSLGGALTPVVALKLKQSGALDKFARTLVYPTAGPSPGNKAFSTLFSQTFPPIGPDGNQLYQAWNQDMSNTLDVVPHAWNYYGGGRGTLHEVKCMYLETCMSLFHHTTLNAIVDVAEINALASGGVYEPIATVYLPGKPFYTAQDGSALPYRIPNDDRRGVQDWMAQLHLQHVPAYIRSPEGPPGLILEDNTPFVNVSLLPGVTNAKPLF